MRLYTHTGNFKNKKGITLVALVITIIILLILAGISISQLTGSGLFERAKEAEKKSKNAQEQENSILTDYENTINEYLAEEQKMIADGSWNSSKKVNSPQLMEGMKGIYWDENGNEVTVTPENQNNWYNYEKQKWANAKTEDGSYWVWIPRYAYKITSNCNTSEVGTIAVEFLQGTTNKDSSGNQISETYPEVENNEMKDYVLHPAFGTNIENGGWDENLAGIWVAKYVAGFQANTTSASDAEEVVNSSDTIIYSNKYYTIYDSEYTTNALSQTLTSSSYSSQRISYPVFKPLTYSYNVISIGDSFTISQEIAKANDFYGLDESKTDSHQMKNSEWGAIAYLTQSSYGRNGKKVTINSKNLNNLNSKNIYGITGYAEETANGVLASSTNNMSGIFDLSGCVWERTSGLISNGNSHLAIYGKSLLDEAQITYSGTNVQAKTGKSTKYVTVYPYSSSDGIEENYNTFKNLIKTRFGDAILETSISGNNSTSWNGEYSYFPYFSVPFFERGGNFADADKARYFLI